MRTAAVWWVNVSPDRLDYTACLFTTDNSLVARLSALFFRDGANFFYTLKLGMRPE